MLFRFMQERGLLDNTLIVFTSDHGDYLGDHWMGEKDLFHEPSVKVPLIVCDPSADGRRRRAARCATSWSRPIDLAPTFLEALGADPAEQSHRLEGRSLMPFLRGEAPAEWRRFAFSEYDYSMLPVAAKLGIEPRDARLFMVADKRWKYVHAVGFRPMLYDLESDPDEFRDLGADPACEAERQRLAAALRRMGPAAVPAHHPLGAADAGRARQVPAPGHPDRRLGRSRRCRRSCGASTWGTTPRGRDIGKRRLRSILMFHVKQINHHIDVSRET